MSIIQFPTEILWIIASSLTGGEICAFAQVHRNIYPKLRLALIKHNVKHQNSSALHWAAKTNNRRFAKTLLSYRADINARVDGLSPLMTAAKYGSGRVINLLLQKKKLRVNMRNSQGESNKDLVCQPLSSGANLMRKTNSEYRHGFKHASATGARS
ncbi:hypothetical protein N7513_007128 [Penicillium frequentans]|nr:hypothetical protein N7513_007128 [Penicillium glabrum]